MYSGYKTFGKYGQETKCFLACPPSRNMSGNNISYRFFSPYGKHSRFSKFARIAWRQCFDINLIFFCNRHLTKHPHIAGSLRNRELALYIKDKWHEYGIAAKLIHYNVLLSFPSKEKFSAVQLINSKDKVNFTTQHKEKAVEASERQSGVLPPFAAYSPSGNVTVRECFTCLKMIFYIYHYKFKKL